MLPKTNRLSKEKDFEKVFKTGRGFREGFLYLKAVSNGFDFSRFGFVVSKKVSKKAVERNRIKRKLREIIRELNSCFKKGLDVVIVVMPGVKEDNLKETIQRLVKQSGILDDSLNKIN